MVGTWKMSKDKVRNKKRQKKKMRGEIGKKMANMEQ
jgi:hypothetical protein